MFNLKQAAFVAAGVAALAGCMQKPVDTKPIEAMIRAHTDAWVQAYNAGDADKIVAGYTDDAIVMPPDVPAAVGKDAIKQFIVADMAASKTAGASFALDSGDTIGVSGDLAWHSGNLPRERVGRHLDSHREVSRGVAPGQGQLADHPGHLEFRRAGRRPGAAAAAAQGRGAQEEKEEQEEIIRLAGRPVAARPRPDPDLEPLGSGLEVGVAVQFLFVEALERLALGHASCALRAPRARNRAPAPGPARRRRTPCTRAPCWRCRP